MLVTLFTDASYDDKQVCSGWGMWAKSNRLERGYSAGGWTTEAWVWGSAQAEMYGVLAGVQHGLAQGVIESGDTVLVQCDCTAVEGLLNLVSIPAGEGGTRLKSWLLAMTRQHRLTYRYKHVKGHKSPFACTRSGVNNLVDGLAREGLSTARYHRGLELSPGYPGNLPQSGAL